MLDIGKNNIIVPQTEILLIKEFKTLWTRDKSKNKEKVLNEFAYIYFKHNFKSTYKTSYTEDEIEIELKRDIFNNVKWKADKILIAAEEKYKSLQMTKSLAFLDSAEKALVEVKKYFNDFNLEGFSEKEKTTAVKNMMGHLKEVEEVSSRLFNARKRVELEQSTKKLSASRTLGSRELPKNKR